MGIVSDMIGGIFGSGTDAAQDAAKAQTQAADKAIAFQRESRDLARQDVSPFRQAGIETLYGAQPTQTATQTPEPVRSGAGKSKPMTAKDRAIKNAASKALAQLFGENAPILKALEGSDANEPAPSQRPQAVTQPIARSGTGLVDLVNRGGEKVARTQDQVYSTFSGMNDLATNPNTQKSFIENNPFFDALANRAKSDLFSNQAAKGKVGSGGTAEALQNSLLLLGQDFVDQSLRQRQNAVATGAGLTDQAINQRYNLATLGSNAASNQASTALQTGSNVSNLLTERGNAAASGIAGARAAQTGALNNTFNTAALGYLAFCDARFKENIDLIGYASNGLPLYMFNYIGDDKPYINVMAQDVEQVYPDAIATIDGKKYVNMEAIQWH